MHLIIWTTVLLLYLYVGKDGEKIKEDLLEAQRSSHTRELLLYTINSSRYCATVK